MSNASSILSNVGSERVRRVAGLIRRQARNRFGRFLVEGPQGVREAVRHAPGAVHDVYATPEAARRHAGIWQEAEAAAGKQQQAAKGSSFGAAAEPPSAADFEQFSKFLR